MKSLIEHIFKINSNETFNKLAIEIFRFQAKNNSIYSKYLKNLNTDVTSIKNIKEIPFLPIDFFKTKKIVSNTKKEEVTFLSSGTTTSNVSKHFVNDLSIYKESFSKCFEIFYGNVNKYCILALLPSYLERKGSSLIYMMNELIKKSKHPDSGFYLNNFKELAIKLEKQEKEKQKTILLGITYALLDFAEKYPMQLNNTIVMETGGMKGKRKEMIKEELHEILTQGFGVKKIHSEYGMTELLSQAYSIENGKFLTPPWMKILIRDIYDPFDYINTGKSGGINVIDLANINSCSFIETQDIGKLNTDNSFEVLGRIDNSIIRGCNLLVPE